MTNFLTLFLYWKVYKNRLESIEERKRFEHVGKISCKATEVGEQSKLVLVHFSFILNVTGPLDVEYRSKRSIVVNLLNAIPVTAKVLHLKKWLIKIII